MNLTKSRLSSIIAEEHDMMIREKETGAVSKTVHTALDLIGLVPVYGEWADIANAAIHAKEGNYLLAALSAISVIPVVGDAIGKGGKTVVKLRRLFPKVMKGVEKYGPEAAKGVRAMRSSIRKNKKAIDKFLDILQEDGHLSDYLDGIRKAIDVLASGDISDEDVTEKISGEMGGTIDDALQEPDSAEVEARESSDSKNVHIDLSISDEDEEDERKRSGSSGDGGSVGGSGGSGGGSWGPFNTDGKINPEYLKFEKLNIDDTIREEINKVLQEGKRKKNMQRKKTTLEDVIRLMLKEGGGIQTDVNLDPDEEEADSKAPNLKTSNQTSISAIGEGDDPVDPMDSRYDDGDDPVDPTDSRYDDRKHAYWIQDPKMWSAFKEYLANGGLLKREVTVDTFKLLSKARAKLDRGESIEYIGKEGTPEHDDNMNFQYAIDDHDPTHWLKKLKGNKMNESKKITKGMVLQVLQEEYQNVFKEYGMKTPYDRDDDAVAGKKPWSPNVGWDKALWDISEELQDMIRTKYQIDDDKITEVALEQPPGSDNYMIRVQWDAPAIDAGEMDESNDDVATGGAPGDGDQKLISDELEHLLSEIPEEVVGRLVTLIDNLPQGTLGVIYDGMISS